MSKKNENINNLSVGQEKCILNLENHFKDYLSLLNTKINEQNEEIMLINLELKKIEEIIDKTREMLLSELESSLDRYNQLRIKNVNMINDMNELFEEKMYSYLMSFSNDEINSDQEEICYRGDKSNEIIDSNNSLINNLNAQIDELQSLLLTKDSKINSLYQNLADKEEIIMSLSKHIGELNDESNIVKLNLSEKEKNIQVLIDENEILKSVINEKDKTINSLNG